MTAARVVAEYTAMLAILLMRPRQPPYYTLGGVKSDRIIIWREVRRHSEDVVQPYTDAEPGSVVCGRGLLEAGREIVGRGNREPSSMSLEAPARAVLRA